MVLLLKNHICYAINKYFDSINHVFIKNTSRGKHHCLPKFIVSFVFIIFEKFIFFSTKAKKDPKGRPPRPATCDKALRHSRNKVRKEMRETLLEDSRNSCSSSDLLEVRAQLVPYFWYFYKLI